LTTGRDWKFPIVTQNICSTVQATRLIELWNSLPDGEQSRCHSPGFAFQLIIENDPVFTAAICWRCNNITFAGSFANLEWRTFDGESDGALQLLQLCQEVAGNFSGELKR
jgi:hypothetical protein